MIVRRQLSHDMEDLCAHRQDGNEFFPVKVGPSSLPKPTRKGDDYHVQRADGHPIGYSFAGYWNNRMWERYDILASYWSKVGLGSLCMWLVSWERLSYSQRQTAATMTRYLARMTKPSSRSHTVKRILRLYVVPQLYRRYFKIDLIF